MILALDTSTEQGSVALASGGEIRAEFSWLVDGNHSRHLARVIQQLFDLESVGPADVSAVVAASGPGSFSGIRVGMSVAKGMAMALDVPLVGVATLDIIGFQGCHVAPRVHAVIGAGRGQVYSGHYSGNPEKCERVGEYTIESVEEAAVSHDPEELLQGPATAAVADCARGMELRLAPSTIQLRRAGFLAELGRRYLAAGGETQLDTLEPIYLRKSAAEEKRASHKE